MRGLNYRFSKGWKRTETRSRGAIDLRKSEWELGKLNFDEQRDYLRVLGICWAKASYPYFNVMRVNMTNDRVMNYVKKVIPEDEMRVKNNGRMTPEVLLEDPAFAYSYHHRPKLGTSLSKYLLEGVLTAAVGDCIWMRTKRSQMSLDQMLGLEEPTERHDKVQVHSRNADVMYGIQFYVTYRDHHKMAWVPYNKGPSIGIWWPMPVESKVPDFVLDNELREEAKKIHSFRGIDNNIIREMCTIAQRHVYEWAAIEGLLGVSQYKEALAISKMLHDEAKALRDEEQQIIDDMGALNGYKIEDFERVQKSRADEKRQKEYQDKLEALRAKIKRLERHESEFLQKAHNLRPKRRGKNRTDGHDYSYKDRQWERQRLVEGMAER